MTFVYATCTLVHVTTPTTASDRLAYTVEEAAELIGMSRSGLYKRIAKGEIATLKIGAARRITREQLHAFLESKAAS